MQDLVFLLVIYIIHNQLFKKALIELFKKKSSIPL